MPQSRCVWIHKDMLQNESYTQPIQQICIGDSITFSVTLSNLNGSVEWIEWEAPTFSQAPTETALTYDKDRTRFTLFSHSSQKIYCDLNRICELEDAIVEWYEAEYFQKQENLYDLGFLRIDGANSLFQLKQLLYAGVDGSICRIVCEATNPGKIEAIQLAGLSLEILPKSAELTNEVKRIGFLRDREDPVQIRVGDTFILYISNWCA